MNSPLKRCIAALQPSAQPQQSRIAELVLHVLLQVTDVPLQDLPQEVKHILEKYAAQLDVHIVSQFVQNILEAVLETVPLDGNLKHGIPKAKVCCKHAHTQQFWLCFHETGSEHVQIWV